MMHMEIAFCGNMVKCTGFSQIRIRLYIVQMLMHKALSLFLVEVSERIIRKADEMLNQKFVFKRQCIICPFLLYY